MQFLYSYKDKIRAVKMQIKLGNRVRVTIRRPGYRTKNALKGLHRKYEQRLDLPVGYATQIPKYSLAQKQPFRALLHDCWGGIGVLIT